MRYGYGTIEDDAAVARYRYLLRTAPPEQLEAVHVEAFARLTAAQRRQVLGGLADEVPVWERAATDDPRGLARLATRAELRRPGTLERVLGGTGPGQAAVGGLLAGVAVTVLGSLVIDGLFDTGVGDSGLFDLGPDGPSFGVGSWVDFGF